MEAEHPDLEEAISIAEGIGKSKGHPHTSQADTAMLLADILQRTHLSVFLGLTGSQLAGKRCLLSKGWAFWLTANPSNSALKGLQAWYQACEWRGVGCCGWRGALECLTEQVFCVSEWE